MFDLGTSFRANVERDPSRLAIVDGTVRLTYAEWYRQISHASKGIYFSDYLSFGNTAHCRVA